jgi:hypothetical protein
MRNFKDVSMLKEENINQLNIYQVGFLLNAAHTVSCDKWFKMYFYKYKNEICLKKTKKK